MHERIDELGTQLRQSLQAVFDRHDIGAVVYGDTSYWHVSLTGQPAKSGWPGAGGAALKRALLNEGVHLISNGGFVSASHEEVDIEQTTIAFDSALTSVVGEGYLAG